MAETDLLIIHGRDGSYHGNHHQKWLELKAKERKLSVIFPKILKMNSDNGQKQLDHAKILENIKKIIKNNQPKCIAAHSLGVLSLLHIFNECSDLKCEKILFAAPARFDPARELFPSFYPVPEVDLKNHCTNIMLAMTKNDPFRTNDQGHFIEKTLKIEAKWYDKGGHMNGEEGFGEWPEALEFLCPS